MASQTRYKKGDWKGVCDACGQRFLMSKLRLRWDGLIVCSKDWNPRQPQDFVRAKVDIQAVPVTRPESADTFIHPDGAIESDLTATLDSLDMEGLVYNQEPIVVDTVLTDETIVFVDDGATVTLPSAPAAPIEIIFPGAGGSASDGDDSFGGSGGSGLYAIPTPDGSGGFDWGIFNLPDCTVLQIPDTNDRGTSVFAGPAEEAYGVPQTTVTITTVAETPCGLALRKTVTKTYSSRIESGLYKGTANFSGLGNFSSEFSGSVFAVGATKDAWASYAATVAANGTSLGGTHIASGDVVTSEGATYSLLSGSYSSYVISYFASGNSFSSQAVTPSGDIVAGNVYYLDVHEVWTYSVI